MIFGFLAFDLAMASEVPLSPEVRMVPGQRPTALLQYQNTAARTVLMAGSWNNWAKKQALQKRKNLWVQDIAGWELEPGRYEFKFIVNGEYESGVNRIFFINEDHQLERPPAIIDQALIASRTNAVLHLRKSVDPKTFGLRLEPDPGLATWRIEQGDQTRELIGYDINGGHVTFVFDESVYHENLSAGQAVHVSGNFNGWNPSAAGFRLSDDDYDGVWEASVALDGLRSQPKDAPLLFKFTIDGERWLDVPPNARNATSESGEGNLNLELDPNLSAGQSVHFTTKTPFDLRQHYQVVLDGVWEKPLRWSLSPGTDVLDSLVSDREPGVFLDKEEGTTRYRLFAPRATEVALCLFDHPDPAKAPPRERYPMYRFDDGMWEVTLRGLDAGMYYMFQVDGPDGFAEGFNPTEYVGDPYAVAAAHAEWCTIVIDREATNKWFKGWTDQNWKQPPHEEAIIYETHVRHLTIHPSSKVPKTLRGTYQGILETIGTGEGLDYLKKLGVNMIELLPVCEFPNGTLTNRHDWGYATAFFFAPESSYAQDPLNGSQYYEFKHFVNEMHRHGFGVMIDVVYNHMGAINNFNAIDKKYYFRHNPDFSLQNYSGCGNDVRTEAPMMRKLIVDNVLFWMKEFHIDGFRFDLAELIDMGTLLELKDKARAINPEVILASEPWSFRGNHKYELTGTGWSAWNGDFRDSVRNFSRAEETRDWAKDYIEGSLTKWAADPMQTVNYVESHDAYSLADELSTREDMDGRHLGPEELDRHRLCATLLNMSLGIPMIAEGQEWMRSKHGVRNTYNKGDRLNALIWTERKEPQKQKIVEFYQKWFELRQSPEAASLRLREAPGPGYFRWFNTENKNAMAYLINGQRNHPGAMWLVLANADDQAEFFEVDVPKGNWVMVSNGEIVQKQGLPGKTLKQGAQKIRVGKRNSLVFMGR